MRFDEHERLFALLLALLKPAFTLKECGEVEHFVKVGEYGLALETAMDIIEEEWKKDLPSEAVRVLHALADLMEMKISLGE
ncbi:MAG: MafI family immunity protein [Gammaproteobacteria bacterium]